MEESAKTETDCHPIFQKDPSTYMQDVYKEICIQTKDGNTHTGRLYTVDPVSESMVLVRFTENKMSGLKLIMGHAIAGVTVLDNDVLKYKKELDALFKTNTQPENVTAEELKKCKTRLKSWLLKNRLPVDVSPDDDNVLCLSDALLIKPPYGPEDCQSTNEIILGRVQGLIKNMPNDVDEW